MAHFIFLVLHVLALMSIPVALFVTVPAHLIYSLISARGKPHPSYRTHTLCPFCREEVSREATVCSHCRNAIAPEPAPEVFSRKWFSDFA